MAKRSPALEAQRSELIILLMLMETKRTGYEIRTLLQAWNIDRYLPVSATTIYRALKRLADEGCLTGKSRQSGRYPVSTVYTITQNGKDKYRELVLAESVFIRTAYSLDAFLGLAAYLDNQERRKIVRDWQAAAVVRIAELDTLIEDKIHGPGRTYGKPFSEWLLIDHERDMLKAEQLWMDKYLEIGQTQQPKK